MTRAFVLLASAILVLGGTLCRAGDAPVPQPVAGQPAECVGCCGGDGGVACPCLHKLWGWLTYCPQRTCACCPCKCDPYYCAPPVYTFFLDHCAGGCGYGGCAHGPAPCSSCGCGNGSCAASH